MTAPREPGRALDAEPAKNGRLLRTLAHDGYTVSEVEFRIDDLGGCLCIGYMVGPDDGHSALSVTPEDAVERFKALAALSVEAPT